MSQEGELWAEGFSRFRWGLFPFFIPENLRSHVLIPNALVNTLLRTASKLLTMASIPGHRANKMDGWHHYRHQYLRAASVTLHCTP